MHRFRVTVTVIVHFITDYFDSPDRARSHAPFSAVAARLLRPYLTKLSLILTLTPTLALTQPNPTLTLSLTQNRYHFAMS